MSIEAIPAEVAWQIMTYCDHGSVCAFGRSLKKYEKIACDDGLWRHLFQCHFQEEMPQKDRCKEVFKNRLMPIPKVFQKLALGFDAAQGLFLNHFRYKFVSIGSLGDVKWETETGEEDGNRFLYSHPKCDKHGPRTLASNLLSFPILFPN